MADAAGRKANPKHASDEEPAKGSGLKLSATVKTEGKAFDTAEECRRILKLLGGENGEDFLQHDQVTQEPRDSKRKPFRSVLWVRKRDEQLNGSKFEPPKKFTDEGDGIMLMCHICASHEMGLGTIALRRIPWHCKACRTQMDLEWVDSIAHVQDQPRFADVPDCKFRDFLFTRNK